MNCGLLDYDAVGGYHRYRGTYRLRFLPEEGGEMFFRSCGNHLQDHTVQQIESPQSTFSGS
jgi:hypothetical protein